MNSVYERKITLVNGRKKLDRVQINEVNDAIKFARNFFGTDIEIYESFFAIMLDQSHHTIAWIKVSQGGINSTVVDVMIVAKAALDVFAKSVIVVHNHPSGNINPSFQDDQITDKIKNALSLFDVKLLDHIILTKNNAYSYKNQEKL